MSYILDALRRAEAERERGSVPGLHSQTVPPPLPEPAQRSTLAPWAAAGLGGAVVLVGATGWFLLRPPGDEPAPVRADAAPIAAQPAAPPTTPIAPVAPAPVADVAAATAAAPARSPAPPPATRPAPPAAVAATPAPAPTPSPSSPAAVAARPAEPAPVPATPIPPSTPSTPPQPAPRAEARAINFEQLPEDVRRALPPLAIGGAIYSDNPTSRMLIVGGQLLHEGDTAAPGVTLEQIKPRSAVLRWKQLRYEITF
jgi:general secretion pathway protein B